MHLIIVSGMLGAGKTSVILKLIGPLAASGKRAAVIENDFGEFGLDSEVIRRGGLEVRDLKGGCVCCTLKANLIDDLRALAATFRPDVAVVEPTGIADPELIVGAVTGVSGLPLEKVTAVAVIDAERFAKVRRMFERPIRNQLKVADLVLMNKVDAVAPAEQDGIEAALRELSYSGPVLRVRADTGEGMDAVCGAIGL